MPVSFSKEALQFFTPFVDEISLELALVYLRDRYLDEGQTEFYIEMSSTGKLDFKFEVEGNEENTLDLDMVDLFEDLICGAADHYLWGYFEDGRGVQGEMLLTYKPEEELVDVLVNLYRPPLQQDYVVFSDEIVREHRNLEEEKAARHCRYLQSCSHQGKAW